LLYKIYLVLYVFLFIFGNILNLVKNTKLLYNIGFQSFGENNTTFKTNFYIVENEHKSFKINHFVIYKTKNTLLKKYKYNITCFVLETIYYYL